MYDYELDKLAWVKCSDLSAWKWQWSQCNWWRYDCHRSNSLNDSFLHFVKRANATSHELVLHVKCFQVRGLNFINCFVEIYKLPKLIVFNFIYIHLSLERVYVSAFQMFFFYGSCTIWLFIIIKLGFLFFFIFLCWIFHDSTHSFIRPSSINYSTPPNNLTLPFDAWQWLIALPHSIHYQLLI